MPNKVVVAGNCYPDNMAIRSKLKNFPGTLLETVDSMEELMTACQTSEVKLILVNRIFDGTGEDGIAAIAQLKPKLDRSVTMMLISNFDWAQEKAVAAGASPGFGKSELHSPQVLEKLAAALS